jgi:putative membrane protein
MKKYYLVLIAVFLAVWVWAAIGPKYRADWLLENYLVFFFVPVILLTGRYFRLSAVSYTLITIFMCLHVIGSHYTYAEVPFGYTLQSWVGANRNMYDRVVHFGFGFFLAYPIREVFIRVAKVKGFWGYYLPLDVSLACSALYEIAEWLTAVIVDPSAGSAFLGTQGDEWDAQKDMLAAAIGATVAMMIIMLINWRYQKDFWKEWRASFRLRRDDQPLGEVRLKEMLQGQG